jgi:hypothetical protein
MIGEAADANFLVHAAWAQSRVSGMTVSSTRGVTVVDSGLACDTFNCVLAGAADGGDRGRPRSPPRSRTSPESAVRSPGGSARRTGPPTSARASRRAGLAAAEGELAMRRRAWARSRRRTRRRRISSSSASRRPRSSRTSRAVNAANWTPPDTNVLRFYALAASVLLSRESPLPLLRRPRPGARRWRRCELAIGGGVARIYNVATLDRFRRRGFASACCAARWRRRAPPAFARVPPGVPGRRRRLPPPGLREFGTITEYKP